MQIQALLSKTYLLKNYFLTTSLPYLKTEKNISTYIHLSCKLFLNFGTLLKTTFLTLVLKFMLRNAILTFLNRVPITTVKIIYL